MERTEYFLLDIILTLGTDLPHDKHGGLFWHWAIHWFDGICIVIYSCQLNQNAWIIHGDMNY